MPMATKLSRVVTYCEGLPPIKTHDSFGHMVLGDHVTN